MQDIIDNEDYRTYKVNDVLEDMIAGLKKAETSTLQYF